MQKNNFDLLRLLAAFQVLFSHTSSHLFSEHGYIFSNSVLIFQKIIHNFPGVPVFFLISGFLIAMSYHNNSDLKEYIKNRILRIYPALYINIFMGVLILYLFGYLTFNREFFLWLIAQMSFLQFYNAEMFRGFGVGVINGSLWTISVELCFYIALPILFFIYKKSKILIGLLFVISFGLWTYDLSSIKEIFYNKLLHVTIFPYFFLFLLGMGFYKFYDRLIDYIENRFIWWLLIYASFLLGTQF
jgi:peptidoglycan/LPS O-acetylase OafA/YrhL